jgi:predicted dithiol-disulfide oxidoreductase (DUF899 family)
MNEPLRHPLAEDADWNDARAALLAEEKALTAATDRVAALRRQMPGRMVTTDYRFVTERGPATLGDLFEGRRQLIIYHHMLRPADPAPCAGCALLGDQVPHLSHLHARDTTLTFVSRAPLAEILAFRHRMGWTMPWAETIFIRSGDHIHHSYSTTGRGTEGATTVWGLLDMTPMGRQEQWQEAPDWVPQGAPYAWWRLHDRYDP